MGNQKQKAIQEARPIADLLLKGKVCIEFKEIPHLKVLTENIEKYIPNGCSLVWTFSKGLHRKYQLYATLIVDNFYRDKCSGEIYFRYNRHNGTKDHFLWKVATPKKPTEMFLAWHDSYQPCTLMQLKPLFPHVHTNIRKQSALFTGISGQLREYNLRRKLYL